MERLKGEGKGEEMGRVKMGREGKSRRNGREGKGNGNGKTELRGRVKRRMKRR